MTTKTHPRVSHMLAAAIAIFATIAAAKPARAQSAELLKALNLTGYGSGTKAPDFAGRTVEGQTLSLASLRGKVVIVNFWATWCLECRPEMPAFERLHREFTGRGFAVIGVNTREPAAEIRRYAKELKLTFPLLLDIHGEINRAYGVIGLPTTFVIGRDGRAVGLAVGPRDWNSATAKKIIMTLLAE